MYKNEEEKEKKKKKKSALLSNYEILTILLPTLKDIA